MKLKPRPLTFTAEDTVFESRQELAENLTNLVKNVEDGLVLALHADWGDGKTTFCKYWIQEHLEKSEGIFPIYLDAFQSDYHDDPLMVITSEIAKLSKEKFPEDKKQAFVDSAKRILSVTVGVGIQAVIAAATGGVGNKAVEGAGEALKNLTDSYIDKRLEERTRIDQDLQAFKGTLKSFIASSQKIVFIIDELDRCKPRFAVELLETIKHFFDVDGMFFLLSMNRCQLVSYVAGEYGIDRQTAEAYLKKFIYAEILLPKINKQGYKSDTYKFCDKLNDVDNLKSVFDFMSSNDPRPRNEEQWWMHGQRDVFPRLASLATPWNLSCRDIQDTYRTILLSYAVTPRNQEFPFILVCFLAIVRTKNMRLFEGLKSQTLSYQDDLEKELFLSRGAEEEIKVIKSILKYCMADENRIKDINYISEEELRSAQEVLNRFGFKREAVIPLICKRLDFEAKID